MVSVDFSDVIDESSCTETSYNNFFRKIKDIMDYMAPYRKMTPKEIKLEQMTWVTRGILVSMRVRDTLYKSWNREKDIQFKTSIFTLYKRYRNMIVNLLRRSEQNYYSLFFLQNQSSIKKTWDGIRNVINVSKKKNSTPT